MNVSGIGTQNTLFHVTSINQNLAKNNPLKAQENQQNRDNVRLSPMGKKQSRLQMLTKQKQDLIDRKNELIQSTTENGGTTADIKSQLDMFEEEMKSIDEQIAQAQTEDGTKKAKNETSGIYEKPKTEEEAANEKLNQITELSVSFDTAQTVSNVKSKMDGEARVLKAEVKTGFGDIEGKLDRIAEIDAKSAQLMSDIGENLQEVNSKVTEIKEAPSDDITDNRQATEIENGINVTEAAPKDSLTTSEEQEELVENGEEY